MKSIIAVIASVLLTSNLQSQTPSGGGGGGGGSSPSLPTRLPIGSTAELRSYALESVRRGSISVSAPGIVHEKSPATYGEFNYTPPPEGVNPLELQQKFGGINFDLETTEPGASGTAYASLGTEDGVSLFFGSGTFILVGTETGHRIKPSSDFKVRLNSEVPLAYFKGFNYAYAEFLNEVKDGVFQSERQNLRLDEQGRLFFPTYLLGRKGKIVVVGNDGPEPKVAVYDIATGNSSGTFKASGGFSVDIDNVLTFAPNPEVIALGIDEGLADSVSVYTFTKDSEVRVGPAYGRRGVNIVEVSTRMWYRRVGSDPSPFTLVETLEATLDKLPVITLKAGRYHVFYEWVDFGEARWRRFSETTPIAMEVKGE